MAVQIVLLAFDFKSSLLVSDELMVEFPGELDK